MAEPESIRDPKDELLGELAIREGYVTGKQLREAFENQRALSGMGLEQDIGLILLSKHLLNEDELQGLRNAAAARTGGEEIVTGYDVISELGKGGFGVVYKAKKLNTGQIVALKILPPSIATDDYVARFIREAQIVRRLHHENIVDSVEVGYDYKHGCHFFALEFIEGENLEERVEREGVLLEEEAISITRQIAQALQHAHFNGLIHRDVKPANIMVRPDGTAKLLDLGLARPASQKATRLTQSGAFVGTPHYVSPEQAKSSKDLDIRSDIYSLGATLYYIVTGRPPFDGETALMVLQQHVYEKLQWPAEINPATSEELCLIITKMMAKDPADRYQVPKDVLYDLDGLKEGRSPEIGEKLKSSSTIAPIGAVVKRRPRPGTPPHPRDRRHRPAGQHVRRLGWPVAGAWMRWEMLLALGAAVITSVLVYSILGGYDAEMHRAPGRPGRPAVPRSPSPPPAPPPAVPHRGWLVRLAGPQPLDCPRRAGSVKIDGRLDEWPELPHECRDPAQICFRKESWNGPQDGSFRFAAEYDGNYVYIAVETTDDTFSSVSPETPVWQQDAIEIRLDARPDPARSQSRGRTEFVDHLFIALNPTGTPDVMCAFMPEKWYEGIRAVCVRTPKGHNTEVAIPVAYLDEKQGQEWQEFRLNIAVDDYDPGPGGERIGAQLWWRPDWRQVKNIPGSGTFRRR